MVLLLLIPLLFGYLAASRVVREPDPVGACVMGAALGISTGLLGVNGVYRLYSAHRGPGGLGTAVAVTLLAQALAILPMLRLKPPKRLPWRVHPVILLVWVVIYFFTVSQQVMNPDDDYWIHTALQGLMRHGNFPPFNPFFSSIPMNGHYGRNLSIVTFAYLSGTDIFMAQHLMTLFTQMLTYGLLYYGIRRNTGSELQALLGASLMELGVNCGGRGGLMDLIQNNNAYVQLYLALYFSLVLTALRGARLGPAALAGMVLGGYAIVYETHFGLSALATVLVLPLAFQLSPRRGALVRAAFLAALVSLPIAATQGGPITNLLERKLSHQAVDETRLSKGMQNQSQVIKLTFPKHDLFKIFLEQGEYQRISMVYYGDTFLHWFYSKSPGRGYAYIWSWQVIKLHFLPLYLAPFSIGYALRRRNLSALWLAAFGCCSYLIPALVDFGPVYESEYYRWECAASLAFAGVLGIELAEWLEPTLFDEGYHVAPESFMKGCAAAVGWATTWLRSFFGTPAIERPPGFTKKRRAWLLLACLLWADTVGCGQFLVDRWRALPHWGGLPHALFFPTTSRWMASHSVLDFQPIDWKAARWLEDQVQPGARLLTNFRQENNFSILFESTLTGVCGARCVGHALPLDDEAIGTTPYHMAAPAAVFWATHDPHQLDLLGVDWIYVRPEPGDDKPLEVPGLTLEHTEREGSAVRYVYRYKSDTTPAATPATLPTVTAVDFGAPALRGGRVYLANVTLSNPLSQPLDLQGADLTPIPHALKDDLEPSDVELTRHRLSLTLAPGASANVALPWMAPVDEGQYRLRLEIGGQDLKGAPFPFEVRFEHDLAALKCQASHAPAEGFVNELVDCQFEIGPLTTLLEGQRDPDVLAAVAARHADDSTPNPAAEEVALLHVGEAPGDYFLLPGVDMEKLTLTAGNQTVQAQLPGRPGRYRLDLFLSTRHGKLLRFAGPLVEVKP